MESSGKTENEASSAVAKEKVSAEQAKIHSEIMKQLLFYFGNANLCVDTFMKREMKIGYGWVKISALLTYEDLASISKDPAVIAAAVKNSGQTILEVNKTNEKIRRTPSIGNEHVIHGLIERSVYCTGFPKKATMRELLEFGDSFVDKEITQVCPLGVNNIFNGTLFLTFISKEQAEDFLKLESVKFKHFKIECLSEKKYHENLMKEVAEIRKKKMQKIKNVTGMHFKKGYLIKAYLISETPSVERIKSVCSNFKWQVDFVKVIDNYHIAWIRLKPVKFAKDLLKDIAGKTSDPVIDFSLPDENMEQVVLYEMLMEKRKLLNEKMKRKNINKRKNKNKGKKKNKKTNKNKGKKR